MGRAKKIGDDNEYVYEDDTRYAFPNGGLEDGMTIRQWYAGQALAGIMANPERWKQIAKDYKSGKKTYEQCSEANAVKAVSITDAMIKALVNA